MNRTIKFRGKRIDNGEWVYGELCTPILFDSKRGYFGEDVPCIFCDEGNVPIIQESVGQFTGLLDKNGKEIYEGDILHAVGGNDATIGKQFYRSVSFVEGCFCLNVTEYNNVSIPLRNHIINHSLNWGIAGNIHDNPEMLKEK